jgi:RNA polymerase sigma factor (sigma-70 family)
METVETLVITARSREVDRAGRHAAFGQLVKQFQDMAYAQAYAVLQEPQLAQDATQEAFVSAYQKLGELREPKAFPGWLRRIVLTQCNRLRRRKRLPTRPIDGVDDVPAFDLDPATAIEKRDLKDKILTAIESLPEHERTVVRLFYLYGYSLKEIAELLSLPNTTIKKRLQYARRRLRQKMAEAYGTTFMACQHDFTRVMEAMVDFALQLYRQVERSPLVVLPAQSHTPDEDYSYRLRQVLRHHHKW